jgi:hypothetical protein
MSAVHGSKSALLGSTLKAGLANDIIQYRAVKRGADADHGVRATAAAVCLGIAMDNQDNIEKSFPLAHRAGEMVQAEIGAAVAIDVRLTPDANGRLITAATGNPVVAFSREAGTTLGQLIVVEVAPAGQVAP